MKESGLQQTYYNKYKKYKQKYLELKQLKQVHQFGGSQHNIVHYNTKANNYISYYMELYGAINKDDFTTDMRKPDKTKILLINSDFLFDIFTNKYGGITPYYNPYYEYPDINQHSIYINWDKVAKDYKGFYLEHTDNKLSLLRKSYASYNKIRLTSWWLNEYERFGTGVIIFV